MRILVAEDDDGIAELISLALGDLGHEVIHAPNGLAALRTLEAQPVDLVLLDMRMPVMDGWTFAARCRARRGPRVPIVVMTAAADAARRASEVGAEGVLPKPFSLEQLEAAIERHARQD